jgi:hypothetical protein
MNERKITLNIHYEDLLTFQDAHQYYHMQREIITFLVSSPKHALQ